MRNCVTYVDSHGWIVSNINRQPDILFRTFRLQIESTRPLALHYDKSHFDKSQTPHIFLFSNGNTDLPAHIICQNAAHINILSIKTQFCIAHGSTPTRKLVNRNIQGDGFPTPAQLRPSIRGLDQLHSPHNWLMAPSK